MKLKCEKISKWECKESRVGLVAPMSPMLATKDFVSKVIQDDDLSLTGLFRLRPADSDAKTFLTEEDMDLYPVEADVLVAMLNFSTMLVFCEMASRYIPICLYFAPEHDAQFNQIYRDFNWLAVPTDEEIIEALDGINREALKKELKDFLFVVQLDNANNWFAGLDAMKMREVLGMTNSEYGAPLKWTTLPNTTKVKIYKEWKGK